MTANLSSILQVMDGRPMYEEPSIGWLMPLGLCAIWPYQVRRLLSEVLDCKILMEYW